MDMILYDIIEDIDLSFIDSITNLPGHELIMGLSSLAKRYKNRCEVQESL